MLIDLLIQEFLSDITFVLDLLHHPDEKKFKENLDQILKTNQMMLKEKDKFEEGSFELNEDNAFESEDQLHYGHEIVWKYKMLPFLLDAYNEPMLNLHFLGPYLKNNSSSICQYENVF